MLLTMASAADPKPTLIAAAYRLGYLTGSNPICEASASPVLTLTLRTLLVGPM